MLARVEVGSEPEDIVTGVVNLILGMSGYFVALIACRES